MYRFYYKSLIFGRDIGNNFWKIDFLFLKILPPLPEMVVYYYRATHINYLLKIFKVTKLKSSSIIRLWFDRVYLVILTKISYKVFIYCCALYKWDGKYKEEIRNKKESRENTRSKDIWESSTSPRLCSTDFKWDCNRQPCIEKNWISKFLSISYLGKLKQYSLIQI